LRIKFLQLRDCWLQKLLDNIPKDDMYHYISKTIDENRVHLFDIITQYKALFSDDDLAVSLQQNTNGYLLNSQQKDLSESKLFNCWILDKITRFLNTLKEVLKI
jgi:conserved oligomeric Golgi complex subunit 8